MRMQMEGICSSDFFSDDFKKKSEAAFLYVTTKLLHKKTNIIYDSVHSNDEAFPSPDEIARSFPNPCGYGTDMEDGMINGATMLAACLNRYELTKDEETQKWIHRIVEGMQRTAFSAKSPGFLPRAICPSDGKSHYMDSSIDQYTMFSYGAYIFTKSALCTEDERKNYAAIMTAVCKRAEKNVTPENNYDMLREDGGASKITSFWGENFEFAAYCRLPMMYLLTYHLTGEAHWQIKYRELRKKAIAGMQKFEEPWHLYVLQQMQCALYVLKNLETQEEFSLEYEKLMKRVAQFALAHADDLKQKLSQKNDFNAPARTFRDCPLIVRSFANWAGLNQFYPDRPDADTFFLLQDTANILITAVMGGVAPAKEAIDLFLEAWNQIDYAKHQRCVSVHFLCAYYSLLAANRREQLA